MRALLGYRVAPCFLTVPACTHFRKFVRFEGAAFIRMRRFLYDTFRRSSLLNFSINSRCFDFVKWSGKPTARSGNRTSQPTNQLSNGQPNRRAGRRRNKWKNEPINADGDSEQ